MNDVQWPPTRAWIMETFAWDWAYTRWGDRLHSVEDVEVEGFENYMGNAGVTTCGLRAFVKVPGIFARMGLPRCAHCSDKLGWPRGVGSPKNDVELRPLVEARLSGQEGE